MSARIPYRRIEDPQAAFSASGITDTDSGWIKLAGTWTPDYKSGDSLGSAISSSAGQLTLPAGVWRVEVSAVYTAIASEGLSWTLDHATLSAPTAQAIGEGGRYANATRQSSGFSRVLHCDAETTFALFANLTNGEGSGTLTLHSLFVRVEYAGALSVARPLPGFWDVNWSDFRDLALAQEDLAETDPTVPLDIDGPIGTWIRREGAANWQARGTEATLGEAAYDGALPALYFPESPATHTGYQLDSQAGTFASDPDFTLAFQFNAPATVTQLNDIFSFSNVSDDYFRVLESGSQYRVQWAIGGVPGATYTAGTVTAGAHWMILRRDTNQGSVTVWVDDPDTPIIDQFPSVTGFTPTFVNLGNYHGSVDTNLANDTAVRAVGLSTRLVSNNEVKRFAEQMARWP